MPSLASSDWNAAAKPAISAAMPSSRSPLLLTSLMVFSAIGACWESFVAS